MISIPNGYMRQLEIVVAPNKGLALPLMEGDLIRIVDIEGQQVTDLVAFNSGDMTERLSGPQTTKLNARLNLIPPNILYSDRCNPLLKITYMSNPQVHCNFVYSPCGPRDNELRFPDSHAGRTCLENLEEALAPWNIERKDLLEPFSIGLNLKIHTDGTIETLAPVSKPGDYIELEAMRFIVVGISACPQDRNQCNAGNPTPVRFEQYRRL
ncbi:MAG TPA: urea carboxylase-associated family protein [Candidatus Nanoarchaeia archaeon]|nr:urea carboxylase-associated family protein [Candidatus Nanoarchaeia archaeon]